MPPQQVGVRIEVSDTGCLLRFFPMHSYGTDLPIMHQSNISMFCKLNTGALLVSAFVAPTTATLPLDETHLASASFHCCHPTIQE